MFKFIKKYKQRKAQIKYEQSLIAAAKLKYKHLTDKHKYCPLSGKLLSWIFYVSYPKIYDSVTGQYFGQPHVEVNHSDYVTYYDVCINYRHSHYITPDYIKITSYTSLPEPIFLK